MTDYKITYTFDAHGVAEPHGDVAEARDWLKNHCDEDVTESVAEVTYNSHDVVMEITNRTREVAEYLGEYWRECENMMTDNPHPLAETVKGFSIDWSRYDSRRGV